MDLAYEAGAILLENGAEISRVEETMRRISQHYGVDDESFFVLSNGIMATGTGYARSKFIPIKGTSLDKVVAVNQLSREVSNGECDLDELERRLKEIRAMRSKPIWEQILASAFGAAAFCIIFGGGYADTLAALIAGGILWVYMLFVGYRHLSRIVATVTGGLLATLLCIMMYNWGLGAHLSNMIIGAIIPLIPGVPFTNGIRDLANEDYLAGITRLLDALLTFFCISLGVAMAFVVDKLVNGQILELDALAAAPETSGMVVQLLAAFIGTVAFAVLFGVPRRYYGASGLCGTLGWLLYLILLRHTGLSPAVVVFLATALVTLTALVEAILRKCPITVFLICGIFPLVPGAGIFWTSYNIVSDQLGAALQTGFVAVQATVAIAFGILIITEINGKNRIGRLIARKRAVRANNHSPLPPSLTSNF
ncbi:MAG: threonine/serine exporter family protein [Bacteroidales bacterium]|nr:threonine/serine exporter family protein [Bacteroidales bacterium]